MFSMEITCTLGHTSVREKHRNCLSDHVSINIYRLFHKNEIEFFTLHIYHLLDVLNPVFHKCSLFNPFELSVTKCKPGIISLNPCFLSLQTLWRISMRLQRMRQINVTGRQDVWNLRSQRRLVGPPPHFFYKYIASLNLLYLFRALLWPSCVQADWDWFYHTSSCSFTSVCMLVRSKRHLWLQLPCYWGSLIEAYLN